MKDVTELTAAALRRLSEFVAGLTPAQLAAVASGELCIGLVNQPRRAAEAVRRVAPGVDVDRLTDELRSMGWSEAAEYIDGLA